jgi:hypothetical protein
MKQCSQCGRSQLEDRYRFCPGCGASLVRTLDATATQALSGANETGGQGLSDDAPTTILSTDHVSPAPKGIVGEGAQPVSGREAETVEVPAESSLPSAIVVNKLSGPLAPVDDRPVELFPAELPSRWAMPVHATLVLVILLLLAGAVVASFIIGRQSVSSLAMRTIAKVATVVATPSPDATPIALTDIAQGWHHDVGMKCLVQQGQLEMQTLPKRGANCLAPLVEAVNAVVTVDAEVVRGPDNPRYPPFYGVIVRYTSNGNYQFQVSTFGTFRLVHYAQGHSKVLFAGKSAAIHTGFGVFNSLRAVVNGATFVLFINGQYVATIQDTLTGGGQIGVSASANCAMIFRNLRVSVLDGGANNQSY